jgi:hypothetical protein
MSAAEETINVSEKVWKRSCCAGIETNMENNPLCPPTQPFSFRWFHLRRYLFVFMLALCLRLLYVVITGRVSLNPDSHEYLTIARLYVFSMVV